MKIYIYSRYSSPGAARDASNSPNRKGEISSNLPRAQTSILGAKVRISRRYWLPNWGRAET